MSQVLQVYRVCHRFTASLYRDESAAAAEADVLLQPRMRVEKRQLTVPKMLVISQLLCLLEHLCFCLRPVTMKAWLM
jgi:hypothetical protein